MILFHGKEVYRYKDEKYSVADMVGEMFGILTEVPSLSIGEG
jgi:hypothetical protein